MNDWAFIDFVRSFLPRWLAAVTSMRVVSIALLVLLIAIVALKVEGSIA